MRPKTVLVFEGLLLGTLALGWLQLALTWNEQMLRFAATSIKNPAPVVLAISIIIAALFVLLILLVSRRRSKVAMWILLALFVIGIPGFFRVLTNVSLVGYMPLAVIQIVGQLIGYAMLATPSTRAWMGRDDEQADLGETFS
jgi:glucan phosphoethanolaminetransferase (alkaline phosphatase superfamily)